MSDIDKQLTEKLTPYKTSMKQLIPDIVNAYLDSQPTIQTRSPEEIDNEIATKLNTLVYQSYRSSRTKQIRNNILRHRVKRGKATPSRNMVASAISDRARAAGKTEEEVERDLLCIHFGIRQVV